MSLTVREKYVWRQMAEEKFSGLGNLIPGTPLFVLPGTGATQLAYVTDKHKYVYTDINSAFASAVDGRGDAIVLLPGAHTLTAALAWNKANVSMYGWEAWMGLDVRRSASVVTAFAANKGITVTAANAQFVGGQYVPITAKSFFDFSALANGIRFKNVYIDMVTPVVNIATKGIVATGGASDVFISDCEIVSGGAQGPAIDITAILDSYIEGCRIYNTLGSWAVGIQCGAGCLGVHIGMYNHFASYGTAMTVGIDGTGADQVAGIHIFFNDFNSLVTGPIKNFSGNTIANITNNFKGTVGAGTGGGLVTVII